MSRHVEENIANPLDGEDIARQIQHAQGFEQGG